MKSIGILISDITVRAGTERAVVSLANMLVKMETYRVIIYSLYSNKGDVPAYETEKRVIVKNLCMKKGNRFVKMINYIKILKLLCYDYDNNNINCVLGTTTAYNVLLSYLKRCGTIGCEHINFNSCTYPMKIARRMRYKRLDYIVVLTKQDKNKYYFIPGERIRVIPNALTIKRDEKSQLDEKTIVSIGRLEKQKGYDILLDMASELRIKLPDWKIVIYGNGSLKDELENTIAERNLKDYVFLYGQTENVKDELLKSSIYIMTSRAEGMGIVLTEAQACGLPIVAFDCESGPSEVIEDGINGYLVKDFDKKLFVNRIVKLAMNLELRKRLGKSGYDSCQKYEDATVSVMWDELFSKV